MDKNTVIGFALIAFILIGYTMMMSPSEEELKQQQAQRDSIAQVDRLIELEKDSVKSVMKNESFAAKETIDASYPEDQGLSDSARSQRDRLRFETEYGDFAKSAVGDNRDVILENELMKVVISTLGGQVKSVELKDYKTYDQKELYLIHPDSTSFNLSFFDQRKAIQTSQLFFEASSDKMEATGENVKKLSMRLYAENENRYIEYEYKITGNSYLIDFDINVVGMDDVVYNNKEFELSWMVCGPPKEKDIERERMTSTVYFRIWDNEVDYISERSDERMKMETKTQWVSFKQQFFSTALISQNGFSKVGAYIESESLKDKTDKFTKVFNAQMPIGFEKSDRGYVADMSFYFGPNHYQTLSDLNLELEEQIDLGWAIFGWVNEYLVIPVFNFLDSFNLNYGLIILLLTIFIKMLLFPLTYKNYKSSAKMKVLKPEIEEINAKFKGADAMKKQQATMELYKKAGVNPMAGCLPMLLQLPILYAMFRFFPASIELRQEAFLWAEDLSSYDSIFSWDTQIPFISSFYGNHISLFTVLMAISTFLYTRTNSQMSMAGAQGQQMKIMMYFMPFMLLFFFNSYSSGLSYYYFLANVITMIQQWVIKKYFIDDSVIHAQIEANRKKPVKKSKFQKRLEDMAKQRGQNKGKK